MAFSTPALARPAVSPIQEQPAERASAASTVAARSMGRCRMVSCLLLRNGPAKSVPERRFCPSEGRLRRPDCRNGSTVNITFFPVKTEAPAGAEKRLFPCSPVRPACDGGEGAGATGRGGQVRRRMTRLRQAGAGGRGEDGWRPFFRPPPAYASPPRSLTCFPATAEGTAAKTGAGKAERGEAGSGTARQVKPGAARQAQERREARRQEVEAASAQSEEASAAGRSRTGRSGTKRPREKRRTAGGGNRPDRKTFMQGAEL